MCQYLQKGSTSPEYPAGQLKADRGAWVDNNLNEQTYKVIDELINIAGQLGTTPARVALAWVQTQPGVTSAILGARTLDQLKDNLAALDVQLQPQHLAALQEVSKPKLNFPYDFLARAGAFSSSGTTINGETNPINPLTPTNDQQRY